MVAEEFPFPSRPCGFCGEEGTGRIWMFYRVPPYLDDNGYWQYYNRVEPGLSVCSGCRDNVLPDHVSGRWVMERTEQEFQRFVVEVSWLRWGLQMPHELHDHASDLIHQDAVELEEFLMANLTTSKRVTKKLRKGWVGFDGENVHHFPKGVRPEVVKQWRAGEL